MSVVHLIDTLTEWAQQNVCSHIKLKVPPENEAPNDADYAFELATPVAFPMYVPTMEKLPPAIHFNHPSLCVRFLQGEDNPAASSGSLEVQFCFSTWDPGIHSKDRFTPNGDSTYRRGSGSFQRSVDGWRDAWNFVDIALRAVESTVVIGNEFTIDRSSPVKYGPLVEQDAIVESYPFWYAWISFKVNYNLRRNVAELQNLL